MPRSTVPVVLVAGYLGSGKTTLLNHVLRHNAGIRIGVVVNDFGSVDIDSMLVAGQVDSVVTLGNGCLCCAVDTDDLDEMLNTFTRTSADVDAIVVEASGVAEPREMVRMILASSDSRIRYGGTVMVVDALHLRETLEHNSRVSHHIATADLVVVNKADAAGEQGVAAALEVVRSAAPATPTVVTSHGAVDVRVLLDPAPDPGAGPRQLTLDDLLRELSSEHEHLHTAYRTFSVETARPLDPRALIAFLENPPAGLYRCKGFVRFSSGRSRFLLQTVGVHIDIENASARGGTALVFIGVARGVDGVEFDVDSARARVDAMIRDRDSTDDEMLVVHRFLRSPFPVTEQGEDPTV